MSIQSVILTSYREEDIAMAKVWLITGSGNGLGRDIAEAALAAGDSVVAGARRTEELAPLVAQYGERVKPVTLEVREEAAAKAAVQLAVDALRAAGRAGQQCRLWEVRAVRADECGGLPGCRGHMLLRRGVHNTRRRARDA
jgi:NAD(P)-dependent dehydrogenase (short-subunit alcohol dehydrogenase family)